VTAQRSLDALFLDRDGVVNEDRPDSVKSWDEFRVLPGVLDALAELRRASIPVVIVTNQAVVGRGAVARETVDGIHARFRDLVRDAGGEILAIHACYHAPEAGCACRKPAPGLLLDAAREHGFDLARVPFVGDDARDLEAATRAGAVPVLVLTGKGRATEARVRSGELRARAVFPDLAAVARAAISGAI
jgi:D-glycero-D-manno-heptose 1,7-bisphosphate phosphatase